MKKTIISLLTVFVFSVGTLVAQDEAANKLRDEGDAALKEKNYAVALAKYSEYLEKTNYADAARIYNAGFCASQANNNDAAVKFFDMAIQKKENLENAYVGKANALKELDKTADFKATAEAGMKAFPENKNLETLVYSYFMKEGQAEQKKGNIAKAEELFKEVLAVSNTKYQGNALYSMGALYYGKGAKALQAIHPLATSDPTKYATEKAKTVADFTKAKEYLEKAVKVAPDNAVAKKTLDSVIGLLK